jgi:hypothetical protein
MVTIVQLLIGGLFVLYYGVTRTFGLLRAHSFKFALALSVLTFAAATLTLFRALAIPAQEAVRGGGHTPRLGRYMAVVAVFLDICGAYYWGSSESAIYTLPGGICLMLLSFVF